MPHRQRHDRRRHRRQAPRPRALHDRMQQHIVRHRVGKGAVRRDAQAGERGIRWHTRCAVRRTQHRGAPCKHLKHGRQLRTRARQQTVPHIRITQHVHELRMHERLSRRRRRHTHALLHMLQHQQHMLHRRRRARLSPQQHTQHATVLGRRQQRWIIARYAHKRLHHTRRMPLRERVMQRHQARRPRAHRPPASSQHARRPTASTPPAAPLNASVYL